MFLGLMLHLVSQNPRIKTGGLALLGFGLLFLGMVIMGDAIRPHRELFGPWLARINGSTTSGLMVGALAAALITGMVQSSGAVIGMGFAMVYAGAITDLEGTYPLIIGANIGTCVTGLLGSVGDHIENLSAIAKRQRAIPSARFSPEMIEDWLSVHRAVEHLLNKVIESLDPEAANFQEIAKEILDLRPEYSQVAIAVRNAHFQRLEEKAVAPIAALLFNDYLSNFWRISKHIKNIALAEQQPRFWLKREKLSKVHARRRPRLRRARGRQSRGLSRPAPIRQLPLSPGGHLG